MNTLPRRLTAFATSLIVALGVALVATPSPVAHADDARANIVKIKARTNNVGYSSANVVFALNVRPQSGITITGMQVRLAVEGRDRGYHPVYAVRSGDWRRVQGYINMKRTGAGRAQVRGTRITIRDSSGNTSTITDTTKSNRFRLLQTPSLSGYVQRTGNRVKVTVNGTYTHAVSGGRKALPGTVAIQFRHGGTWRTWGRVRMNSQGKAAVTKSQRARGNYRLVFAGSNSIAPSTSASTRVLSVD